MATVQGPCGGVEHIRSVEQGLGYGALRGWDRWTVTAPGRVVRCTILQGITQYEWLRNATVAQEAQRAVGGGASDK